MGGLAERLPEVPREGGRDRPLIAASSATVHGWAAFSCMACSAALSRGSADARYQRGAVAAAEVAADGQHEKQVQEAVKDDLLGRFGTDQLT